jgi:inhibitor of KinA
MKLKKIEASSKLHTIPCCYELGEDLEMVAKQLELKVEQVIELHCETTFTIYAIGFSPGFPYLGWLPKKLQGIARRKEPRLKVPAGSVALVGKQSCVYPQSTPGGWALIGRTPMKLVDVQAGYFPLAVGDQVRFERMTEEAYRADSQR